MTDDALVADATLFQKFLVWIYDAMQPKRQADALPRPESALAVVIAIRQAHDHRSIATPPVKEIRRVLRRLGRAYVEELGTAALLPQRKAPLTDGMLNAMLALRSFNRPAASTFAPAPPRPICSAESGAWTSSHCPRRA
jgi:hypothetical protein